MRRTIDARARPDDWESNVLAGLEDLGARGPGVFDGWARSSDGAELAPSREPWRFDVCVDVDPPPRLA